MGAARCRRHPESCFAMGGRGPRTNTEKEGSRSAGMISRRTICLFPRPPLSYSVFFRGHQNVIDVGDRRQSRALIDPWPVLPDRPCSSSHGPWNITKKRQYNAFHFLNCSIQGTSEGNLWTIPSPSASGLRGPFFSMLPGGDGTILKSSRGPSGSDKLAAVGCRNLAFSQETPCPISVDRSAASPSN